MYYVLIEKADDEITVSVYVKTVSTVHSFTETRRTCGTAGFIFESTFVA